MSHHTVLALVVVGIVLFAVFVPFGATTGGRPQSTLWEDVKSGKLHFPTFQSLPTPAATGALTVNVQAPAVTTS
jgi:hypothetical protein